MNLQTSRFAALFVSLLLLLSFAATPAFAADVNTIAGNGLATFSGDGGPATAAALIGPAGVAVAADGTVYIADSGNLRVRRVSPGGVITTIAGTGTYGDGGDGGPATAAQLGGVDGIALSPADDILYITDVNMNRVRRIDLGSGVITTLVGHGPGYVGNGGNGGPAADAWIGVPLGITVDPAGNVYFSELMYCTVRKVDIATGIITRVAGSAALGDCGSDGDGGPALAARLNSPSSLATDAAGNVYVVDLETDTVRRIDAVTQVITTIAGGGVTPPGFGAATSMDLGELQGIAIEDARHLYLSNLAQVFRVDLDTGILSVIAGTGTTGFSGDGGPALDATFWDIWGLDVRGATLFMADAQNHRIRAIVSAPPPPPDDLLVELATSQAVLDSLNAVAGSILMVNVDGREYLVVPNATSVGLDVTLTGNDQLLVIDLHALQSVGGNLTIAGNLVLQSVDLGSLATVGGSLAITGNPALSAILISGVTRIDGDLAVVGTAATVIDLSSLTTVGGSVEISGNTGAEMINMSAIATVGVNLEVSDNTSATMIDMSSLATAGGSVEISGNTGAEMINMSAIATVGVNLEVSDNTSATMIDMSSLTTTGGSVDISGNTAVEMIDMTALTTVSGDVTIVDNGDAMVNMAESVEVSGSVTIETTGVDMFAMGASTVTGAITIDATGYAGISGTTPGGALDLAVNNPEALMHLQVQAATFETPVSFTVNRLDPVGLVPESGLDAGGAPATIDPVAAYQFDFGVPTLGRDATLSFDIELARLDAATRTTILDALAAGTATLVTRGDAVGSVLQAFPVCSGGQTSSADGCVQVETFDALGQPTSGTPATVRFSNVVGHFSTWAVATVTRTAQANRTVLCATLGTQRFVDIQFFSFSGVKGEQVTVRLAPNPAGTFTPGRAALTLFGIGQLRVDATDLPNTIKATLPRTGKYLVAVSELPWRTSGKFKGAYCVSLESSKNAWQSFRR